MKKLVASTVIACAFFSASAFAAHTPTTSELMMLLGETARNTNPKAFGADQYAKVRKSLLKLKGEFSLSSKCDSSDAPYYSCNLLFKDASTETTFSFEAQQADDGSLIAITSLIDIK